MINPVEEKNHSATIIQFNGNKLVKQDIPSEMDHSELYQTIGVEPFVKDVHVGIRDIEIDAMAFLIGHLKLWDNPQATIRSVIKIYYDLLDSSGAFEQIENRNEFIKEAIEFIDENNVYSNISLEINEAYMQETKATVRTRIKIKLTQSQVTMLDEIGRALNEADISVLIRHSLLSIAYLFEAKIIKRIKIVTKYNSDLFSI